MRLAQWNNLDSATVIHFQDCFARKLITAMFFAENASKQYYVTNEMMKRRHLLNIVLLLAGYVMF